MLKFGPFVNNTLLLKPKVDDDLQKREKKFACRAFLIPMKLNMNKAILWSDDFTAIGYVGANILEDHH